MKPRYLPDMDSDSTCVIPVSWDVVTPHDTFARRRAQSRAFHQLLCFIHPQARSFLHLNHLEYLDSTKDAAVSAGSTQSTPVHASTPS